VILNPKKRKTGRNYTKGFPKLGKSIE